MRFKEVYHFMVWDEIKNGNTVYGLDREKKKVFICNDVCVESFIATLKEAEGDTNRFEFWKEIIESEENENA